MANARSCPDDPGTHYEIPRDVYEKLHELAALMKRDAADKAFAAALQALLDRIICVIED